MKYVFESSHVQIEKLTAVLVERRNKWVPPKVPRKRDIVNKISSLYRFPYLIVKVDITQLRVHTVNHQTNFVEFIVLDYKRHSLPYIPTAPVDSVREGVRCFGCACSHVVIIKKLFYCECVVGFFVQ